MAGLGGLAGFIAGNPTQAYQQSRLGAQKVQQGDIDAQAQAAAGNAYQAMIPGAQPMTPTQQQGQGLLQTILQRLQGGGPSSSPSVQPSPGPGMGQGPGGPMPGGSPPSAVPGARPMQPPQMGMGGPSPQPPSPGMGQPPPGGPTMPGQPPQQMGGQGGGLTWQGIVQQVVRANPGVKDPRVIAAAVDRFIPIMNAQSLQEWRQNSAQWRGFNAETGRERADTSREQGEQRIQQGERRLDQSEKKEERIQGRFDARMAAQKDQRTQILQMQRERLEEQIRANKDKTMLGQWRALLDAERARMQATIGAAGGQGLSGPEGKKQLDEMNKYYDDKIREMKSFMEGGSTSAPQSTGGGPAPPKVGDVQNGYKFKGGDPSKPESWEKVQ